VTIRYRPPSRSLELSLVRRWFTELLETTLAFGGDPLREHDPADEPCTLDERLCAERAAYLRREVGRHGCLLMSPRNHRSRHVLRTRVVAVMAPSVEARERPAPFEVVVQPDESRRAKPSTNDPSGDSPSRDIRQRSRIAACLFLDEAHGLPSEISPDRPVVTRTDLPSGGGLGEQDFRLPSESKANGSVALLTDGPTAQGIPGVVCLGEEVEQMLWVFITVTVVAALLVVVLQKRRQQQ
jgi:hypothetical protein